MSIISDLLPKHWWAARNLTGLVDNDPVSTFTDSGSGAKNFTASSTARPLYKTNVFNNQPALRFDGVNDAMTAGVAADFKFLSDGSPHTVVILYKGRDGANPGGYYNILDNCAQSSSNVGVNLYMTDDAGDSKSNRFNWFVGRGVGGTNTFLVTGADEDVEQSALTTVVARYDEGASIANAAEYILSIDNAKSYSGNSAAAPSSSNPTFALTMGSWANATGFSHVDIAEVIIFDRFLMEVEADLVYAYIRDTYPVAVCQRNYGVVSSNIRDLAYDSFPGICSQRAATAPLIAAWRQASTHIDDGDRGVIAQSISHDGNSWKNAKVAIFDPTYDMRVGMLTRIADDHLVMATAKTLPASTGYGLTDACGFSEATTFDSDGFPIWGSVTYLNDGFTAWSETASRIVKLSNGDWIFPYYGLMTAGTYTSTRLMRRTGGTGTFGSEVTIADGPAASKQYNECDIIEYSAGNLVCGVRNETDTRIDFFFSTDYGATWGTVVTGFAAFSIPAMHRLASGRIILMYRSATAPYPGRWAYSDDNGSTWTTGQFFDRRGAYIYNYGQFAAYDNGELWAVHSWEYSGTSALNNVRKWDNGTDANGVGQIESGSGSGVSRSRLVNQGA